MPTTFTEGTITATSDDLTETTYIETTELTTFAPEPEDGFCEGDNQSTCIIVGVILGLMVLLLIGFIILVVFVCKTSKRKLEAEDTVSNLELTRQPTERADKNPYVTYNGTPGAQVQPQGIPNEGFHPDPASPPGSPVPQRAGPVLHQLSNPPPPGSPVPRRVYTVPEEPVGYYNAPISPVKVRAHPGGQGLGEGEYYNSPGSPGAVPDHARPGISGGGYYNAAGMGLASPAQTRAGQPLRLEPVYNEMMYDDSRGPRPQESRYSRGIPHQHQQPAHEQYLPLQSPQPDYLPMSPGNQPEYLPMQPGLAPAARPQSPHHTPAPKGLPRTDYHTGPLPRSPLPPIPRQPIPAEDPPPLPTKTHRKILQEQDALYEDTMVTEGVLLPLPGQTNRAKAIPIYQRAPAPVPLGARSPSTPQQAPTASVPYQRGISTDVPRTSDNMYYQFENGPAGEPPADYEEFRGVPREASVVRPTKGQQYMAHKPQRTPDAAPTQSRDPPLPLPPLTLTTQPKKQPGKERSKSPTPRSKPDEVYQDIGEYGNHVYMAPTDPAPPPLPLSKPPPLKRADTPEPDPVVEEKTAPWPEDMYVDLPDTVTPSSNMYYDDTATPVRRTPRTPPRELTEEEKRQERVKKLINKYAGDPSSAPFNYFAPKN